jgi:leucyl/phenylalanyl-tRNA---protein transferase
MSITPARLTYLAADAPPTALPKPQYALTQPDGLLAIGGQLTVAWLRHAYAQASFPWFGADEPICWWSPAQRAVFTPPHLRQRRSIRRAQQRYGYRVSINQQFRAVMTQCRVSHQAQGVWISPQMIAAYTQLHTHGDAHSIEVLVDDQLVGGLYGVQMGQVFFAESMFSHLPSASQLALLTLIDAWPWPLRLIDAQFMNPHLERLGATLIPRAQLLAALSPAPAA